MSSVPSSLPRCCRWENVKLDTIKLADFRVRIDNLSLDDVVMRPWEDHRDYTPFREFALYKGWLVWGDIAVMYMADRVRWQFGFVQKIPADPLRGPRPSMRAILQHLNFYQSPATRLRRSSQLTYLPYEIEDGYYQWYVSVSIPRLTPMPEPQPEIEPAAASSDEQEEDVHRERTVQERIDSAAGHILHCLGYEGGLPPVVYERLLLALGDLDLGNR